MICFKRKITEAAKTQTESKVSLFQLVLTQKLSITQHQKHGPGSQNGVMQVVPGFTEHITSRLPQVCGTKEKMRWYFAQA